MPNFVIFQFFQPKVEISVKKNFSHSSEEKLFWDFFDLECKVWARRENTDPETNIKIRFIPGQIGVLGCNPLKFGGSQFEGRNANLFDALTGKTSGFKL